MDFQKIPKIESVETLSDLAFQRATKAAEAMRKKRFDSRMDKSKDIEIAKLEAIHNTLRNVCVNITKAFPALDDLPEFYKELVKVTLDFVYLKKSLASLNWMRIKLQEFYQQYMRKIRGSRDPGTINQTRRAFYGRIGSLLKQVGPHLAYLENARKTLRQFPSVKEGKTIVIFGFPNVGKTTLLSKLTSSKPEIAAYPFTTKGINVGYGDRIQFLDTPGTLDRFDKMNIYEKQALLAIKYLAEKIIYVFDLTEPFPLDDQIALYEILQKKRKPVIIYVSKADIIDKNVLAEFTKKFDAVSSVEELKKKI